MDVNIKVNPFTAKQSYSKENITLGTKVIGNLQQDFLFLTRGYK